MREPEIFPGGSQLRICLQCRKHGFDPWVGKILWRRKWQPAPVLLPGKSHGQRSLEGYSPWGCRRVPAAAAAEVREGGGSERGVGKGRERQGDDSRGRLAHLASWWQVQTASLQATCQDPETQRASRESGTTPCAAFCACCHFSYVPFFVTPCTAALQAPLSMGFSRQ